MTIDNRIDFPPLLLTIYTALRCYMDTLCRDHYLRKCEPSDLWKLHMSNESRLLSDVIGDASAIRRTAQLISSEVKCSMRRPDIFRVLGVFTIGTVSAGVGYVQFTSKPYYASVGPS